MTETQTDHEDTAVVLVSGGMDSATASFEAADQGYDLCLLHTSYEQETEDKEFVCAHQLVDMKDVTDFLHIKTGHLA